VPIDRKYVGFSLPPFPVLVDRERLRRFAEALSPSDTVLIDATATIKLIAAGSQ
jgi:hypothetical protein